MRSRTRILRGFQRGRRAMARLLSRRYLCGSFRDFGEGKDLLFGYEENRFAACGYGFGVRDRFLCALGFGAGVQGLNGREVNLCDSVERWHLIR